MATIEKYIKFVIKDDDGDITVSRSENHVVIESGYESILVPLSVVDDFVASLLEASI